MQISYKWLADLVEELPPVERLAELLTHAGLEVEAIERQGEGLEKVVVGQVVEKTPVPKADKLNVCAVEAGQGERLQIVCGAANYAVGDKVPVALVGAVLPGDFRIEPRELRGVRSAGMLCSAKELGVAEDSDGLLILERDAPIGMPIVDHLGLDDVVLTLNATPNRPDWLSHLGVAREVAALTGTKLRKPASSPAEGGASTSDRISIEIAAEDRCGRYAARVVEGVKFGPSPSWMRQRLEACGVRALGNVIDVTNYVLLETGHPLHAFDLEKIRGGRLVIRMAKEGERLVTLDEKERTLTADDLVIADAERPLVLAGVMGGADAEVGESTKKVLLESAHFLPSGVRRASKRHGIHSESSHRFERGADPEAVRHALDRAAALLLELAGGEARKGVVDLYPGRKEPGVVELRYDHVGRLLGAEVPAEESRKILVDLGFDIVREDGNSAAFRVPTFRTDVSIEPDLIEEVARIRGYAKIPASLVSAGVAIAAEPTLRQALGRARMAMLAAGLDEVLNYSFLDPKDHAALYPRQEAPKTLRLKNPLTETQSAMRRSMLPGLLRNAAFNLNRQVADLRLYEAGKVFEPVADTATPVREPWRLSGLLLGRRFPAAWNTPSESVDFFDVRGVVEGVLEAMRIEGAAWRHGDRPWLHPRSACEVRLGDAILGSLGELHPLVAREFDLPAGVFVFDLDLEALAEAMRPLPRYRGVPRFPAVLRDLAVVVPTEVSAAQVEAVLRGPAGGGIVEAVELFDVYEGPQLGPGRKNLAFAIRYRAPDRTLADAEVGAIHDALVEAVAKEAGAELRA